MVEDRLAAINAHFNPKQIIVTVKDKVALVKLNPPTKLVFMNIKMMQELEQIFLQLEKDDSINVVILTGKGNTFGVGADLNEIVAFTSKSLLFNDGIERCWYRILPVFRKPFIAAINGIALGGGLEVAMMADILVCTENAKMGLPETGLGVMCGTGG